MKRITFIFIFAFLILIGTSFAQEEFIHDNANLFSDKSSLEGIADEINRNYGARVIVYTVDNDQSLNDLYENGFLDNKLKDSLYFPNMNILILYKPGLEYPILIFSDNCGFDKEELKYILNNEYLKQEDLPENSEMFVQVSSPDGEISYSLGVGTLLYNKEYDLAFSRLIYFLQGQIKSVVNPDTASLKYKYCPVPGQLYSEGAQSSPKPQAQEIKEVIIERLKVIEPAVREAIKKYPRVNKNLEFAKIAAESGGLINAVSTRLPDGSLAGDYGLTQLNPCTAKELGVIKKVDCAMWTSDTKINPCDLRQCPLRKITSTDDLKNIFDTHKNIFAGTKYLSDRLKDCSFISEKYDRIRCALASYNSGHGSVKRAIAKADSTEFKDYFNRLPKPEITGPYVDKIISYMAYLEENPQVLQS